MHIPVHVRLPVCLTVCAPASPSVGITHINMSMYNVHIFVEMEGRTHGGLIKV